MRFVKGLANSTFTYVPNMIHICLNNIYTVMEREREREREREKERDSSQVQQLCVEVVEL